MLSPLAFSSYVGCNIASRLGRVLLVGVLAFSFMGVFILRFSLAIAVESRMRYQEVEYEMVYVSGIHEK
jgi:hypothetical protein